MTRTIARVLIACIILVGLLVPALAEMAATVPKTLSVSDAQALVGKGKLDLVDIRRPSEWRRSGVAKSAQLITMHNGAERFIKAIRERQAANGGRPIALICHGGVRSKRMQNLLARSGIQVSNVGAGMFGNRRGDRGWLPAGLPTRSVSAP